MDVSCHVEVVCLLSKLRTKHNIEVELTMSKMDLTAAESNLNITDDEIIIYQTEDGQTKIDIKFENETVWLT